jgi:hypothetical protein
MFNLLRSMEDAMALTDRGAEPATMLGHRKLRASKVA